jgi:hypothetical protein
MSSPSVSRLSAEGRLEARALIAHVRDAIPVRIRLALVRHAVGIAIAAGAAADVHRVPDAVAVAVSQQFICAHINDWRGALPGVRLGRIIAEPRGAGQIEWHRLGSIDIPVQVSGIGRQRGIIAGVDARRVGAQSQVAGVEVDQARVGADVPRAT